MIFILICFCIYLFLKYRDLTKEIADYSARVETLEDILLVKSGDDLENV